MAPSSCDWLLPHHRTEITGDSEVSVFLRKDLLYAERDYTFTKINEIRKLTKKFKSQEVMDRPYNPSTQEPKA